MYTSGRVCPPNISPDPNLSHLSGLQDKAPVLTASLHNRIRSAVRGVPTALWAEVGVEVFRKLPGGEVSWSDKAPHLVRGIPCSGSSAEGRNAAWLCDGVTRGRVVGAESGEWQGDL